MMSEFGKTMKTLRSMISESGHYARMLKLFPVGAEKNRAKHFLLSMLIAKNSMGSSRD